MGEFGVLSHLLLTSQPGSIGLLAREPRVLGTFRFEKLRPLMHKGG